MSQITLMKTQFVIDSVMFSLLEGTTRAASNPRNRNKVSSTEEFPTPAPILLSPVPYKQPSAKTLSSFLQTVPPLLELMSRHHHPVMSHEIRKRRLKLNITGVFSTETGITRPESKEQ